MKKNLLALAAFVFAVVLSSYTVRVNTIFYEDYISGAHNVKTNYSESQTMPTRPVGTLLLDWFSIESVDGVVDVAEFAAAFAALDSDSDNSLNDEDEKIVSFTYMGTPGLKAELEKR